MAENAAAYRRCYRSLSAAGTLEAGIRDLFRSDAASAKLAKRAKGIITRELGRDGGQAGTVTRRFLSAISCQGRVTLWDTVAANYPRVYELQDSRGLAHELLTPILNAAAARGCDVIACPSPLAPDRLEHLLIPALGLAFVSSSGDRSYPGHPYRRLHLDAIHPSEETYRKNRARVRFSHKVAAALLEDALQSLAQAKEAHDALERFYNPHVDFSAVYADADALAGRILGTA